ncbi:hypothetical protein C8Q80DRAFT_704718 [Daedaleopsis nitida]|nr:hypothetical protein C8Q80DRAFT_704718 [Daedaleopsis nitida]
MRCTKDHHEGKCPIWPSKVSAVTVVCFRETEVEGMQQTRTRCPEPRVSAERQCLPSHPFLRPKSPRSSEGYIDPYNSCKGSRVDALPSQVHAYATPTTRTTRPSLIGSSHPRRAHSTASLTRKQGLPERRRARSCRRSRVGSRGAKVEKRRRRTVPVNEPCCHRTRVGQSGVQRHKLSHIRQSVGAIAAEVVEDVVVVDEKNGSPLRDIGQFPA